MSYACGERFDRGLRGGFDWDCPPACDTESASVLSSSVEVESWTSLSSSADVEPSVSSSFTVATETSSASLSSAAESDSSTSCGRRLATGTSLAAVVLRTGGAGHGGGGIIFIDLLGRNQLNPMAQRTISHT